LTTIMFFAFFKVQTYIKQTESYYDHQHINLGKSNLNIIKFS